MRSRPSTEASNALALLLLLLRPSQRECMRSTRRDSGGGQAAAESRNSVDMIVGRGRERMDDVKDGLQEGAGEEEELQAGMARTRRRRN